jgi:hypothetical protein
MWYESHPNGQITIGVIQLVKVCYEKICVSTPRVSINTKYWCVKVNGIDVILASKLMLSIN